MSKEEIKNGKSDKKERKPLTKKQLIMIIVLSVAAALIICAAIIIPIALTKDEPTTLDGVYKMSVTAASELTSTYTFDGDRATNTYYDGEDTVTVEYTYVINNTSGGRTITFTNTADGTKKTFDYREVTSDGEIIAVIINTVWYEKQ